MQKKPQPRRRTQEERKADSERDILRAAMQLFGEKGFWGTTLNQVGERAGYTGGLAHHRFGSKAGLLHAVVAQISRGFYKAKLDESIRTTSAEQSLVNLIEAYLNAVTPKAYDLRALYVLMGESSASFPEVRKEIRSVNRHARKLIEEIISLGIENSEFRDDVDPKVYAVTILGVIRGVVMQYLIDERAVRVKQVLPLVLDIVLTHLKRQ